MGLSDLVARFLRPRNDDARVQTKSSRAGPMIAWSHVGQPQWTPRRIPNLAEEGFRKNVIAYRCVMQIATSCASVPWLLYDEAGSELDAHPMLELLAHPNPLQDGVSFMESLYAHLQISGNAFIEAIRPHPDAPPTELYILRPDRMKVVPGSAGMPQAYQYSVNGQVTSWPSDPFTGASDILHLKTFHPLDDWYGLAPMEAALLSIDQHNAAGAWNQALLNQGARPSGALVYAPKDGGPATLSDDQLQRLREEMGQLYQGDRNAGRPLILEGGLDWREMSLSPKDMDWLSGRNAAARDIALAFGVPAQIVGIPDAQTYANYEQARMAFYEDTVVPLVTRVIAGVDHWLSPMYGDRPELDFDADDISALVEKRQAQWDKLQNAHFLTRNEKREAAGYASVPGGDEEGSSDLEPNQDVTEKLNPYHDGRGRFTFAPGGVDEKPGNNENHPTDTTATPTAHPSNQGRGVYAVPRERQNESVVPASYTAQDSEREKYPTSSVTSMSDAQQIVNNADGYLGKNDQCASLTHALSPELPAASQWLPGDRVQGKTDIPVGTPIATFNYQGVDGTNGYGPPDNLGGLSGYSHTGIYLGQDATGLEILHQYSGTNGPIIKTIPWGAWGKYGLEGGSRYYTIRF